MIRLGIIATAASLTVVCQAMAGGGPGIWAAPPWDSADLVLHAEASVCEDGRVLLNLRLENIGNEPFLYGGLPWETAMRPDLVICRDGTVVDEGVIFTWGHPMDDDQCIPPRGLKTHSLTLAGLPPGHYEMAGVLCCERWSPEAQRAAWATIGFLFCSAP